MITKNQYCRMLISEFAKTAGLTSDQITESHIYESSSLAVAMEYLGLLRDQRAIQYAAERGGIAHHYIEIIDGKCVQGTLSVREMIELLPETVT
jgi:hypothetical protein